MRMCKELLRYLNKPNISFEQNPYVKITESMAKSTDFGWNSLEFVEPEVQHLQILQFT